MSLKFSKQLYFVFTFSLRLIKTYLNHLDKYIKTKETKDQTCWFLKIFI